MVAAAAGNSNEHTNNNNDKSNRSMVVAKILVPWQSRQKSFHGSREGVLVNAVIVWQVIGVLVNAVIVRHMKQSIR